MEVGSTLVPSSGGTLLGFLLVSSSGGTLLGFPLAKCGSNCSVHRL